MERENNAQFNLREILRQCRSTLDDLNENSLVAKLREQNNIFDNALQLIEKYLPVAENALDQDRKELGTKAATIFLINLWSKLSQGGTVAELTKDDWRDVMGGAAENAVSIDPQEYSLMVFDLYKRSIKFAITPMSENASESVINRLDEIVSLMEGYDEALRSGEMSEVAFIEENMWLSLEAIFLVMTDRMSHMLLSDKRRELAEAVSALVFQKIRNQHYDEELAAINECLEYQSKLDQRLTERVNAYIDALRDELDAFDAMVEKAFDTSDFKAAFKGSIELAESLGADGILQTQDEVDDFFLS